MKITYRDVKFKPPTLALIERCNTIIAEYTARGFQLTLRQLFYQLVSRRFIENRERAYKNLGVIVNNARLGGLIDWEAIEDRTRNVRSVPRWESPASMVEACAEGFHIDLWAGQKFRPEVWIEKDALAGVIEPACTALDVPYLSCRGYTSQSEMWAGAMRLKQTIRNGQTPVILYLGDHDPSGLDMTRDIADRLGIFMGGVRLERLALNMDQVEEYKPPPNPAKTTDSRFAAYLTDFGDESWELDALEPTVLDELIRSAVGKLIDKKKWNARQRLESAGRKRLRAVAKAVKTPLRSSRPASLL